MNERRCMWKVYAYVNVYVHARLQVLCMRRHICTFSTSTSMEVKSWEFQKCEKLLLPNNEKEHLGNVQ